MHMPWHDSWRKNVFHFSKPCIKSLAILQTEGIAYLQVTEHLESILIYPRQQVIACLDMYQRTKSVINMKFHE